MEISLEQLIKRVAKTKHGFSDIQKAADEVLAQGSAEETLALAKKLLASEVHQASMLAVFLLGGLAARSKEAFKILKTKVSKDEDWRVQEILAQAFNRYCSDIGYEAALPVMREWLGDASANIRRAASEGPRIWSSRPFFREHPEAALGLLGPLRDDESEYVRKSIGNAIRDISRKHKDLVRKELSAWDTSDKRIAQTHGLAARFL